MNKNLEARVRGYHKENVTIWTSNGTQVAGVVESVEDDCVVLKTSHPAEQILVRLAHVMVVYKQQPQ